MDTKDRATPRPWSFVPARIGEPKVWIYGGADRVRIAVAEFGLNYGQDLNAGTVANAALIVRAVNAYDDMLAALEYIAQRQDGVSSGTLFDQLADVRETARKALAKAEGAAP